MTGQNRNTWRKAGRISDAFSSKLYNYKTSFRISQRKDFITFRKTLTAMKKIMAAYY
jgi:hypothetical protein